jgi:hypothetical protein
LEKSRRSGPGLIRRPGFLPQLERVLIWEIEELWKSWVHERVGERRPYCWFEGEKKIMR